MRADRTKKPDFRVPCCAAHPTQSFDTAQSSLIVPCDHFSIKHRVQTRSEAMSIWKTAMTCTLAGALIAGEVQQVAAAPMPTNVGTIKAMVADSTTQVHWRGGGWGFGIGALAAGAIIGGAIASGPYGYYGGPYYGYPGYGYGYAPAYYGYGPYYGGYAPYYGYRRYYRPYGYYRPYYGYRYGYYRPYRVYRHHYYRRHW
jgi:hypothetical protein